MRVDIGCADNSSAPLSLLTTANALVRAIAQEAKQLACSSQFISPISFRKSVPPSAASTRPGRSSPAPANDPFSEPKNSLEQACRSRSAVELHKRRFSPVRPRVQKPGHHFLARSTLSLNENGKITRKSGIDLAPELAHGRRAAKNDSFIRQLGGIDAKALGQVCRHRPRRN